MGFTATKKGFTPIDKEDDDNLGEGFISPEDIAAGGKAIVPQKSGSISTEKTITVTDKSGKTFVIPSIVNGKSFTPEAAEQMFIQGQIKPIAFFDSIDEATKFSEQRSRNLDKAFGGGGRLLKGLSNPADGSLIDSIEGLKLAQVESDKGFKANEESGFTPNEESNVSKNLEGLTLRPFGIDTGIELPKKFAAGLVSAGGALTRTARGVKQFFSDDAFDVEADNERLLRLLREDPEFSTASTIGDIVGTVADPVLLALPLGRAKSTIGLLERGGAFGAAEGFFKAKEEEESRLANAARTALVTAPGFVVVGQLLNRLSQKAFLPFLENTTKKKFESVSTSAAPDSIFDVSKKVEPVIKTKLASNDSPIVKESVNEAVDKIKASTRIDTSNDVSRAISESSLTGHLRDIELVKGAGGRITGQPIDPTRTNKADVITNVADVKEPFFTSQLSQETRSSVNKLAKEFFKDKEGFIIPGESASDAVARFIASGAVPDKLLAKHGLNTVQFTGLIDEATSASARRLNELSQIKKVLRDRALKNMTPEERLALRKAGADTGAESEHVRSFWNKLPDLWRAGLVVQPATAVRNALTQAGRLGLDAMQAPIDHWLQRMTGRQVTVQPLDGLNVVFSLFRKNKESTDFILQAFPKQKDRLF